MSIERIIKLLDRYDGLAAAGVKSHNSSFGELLLEELRQEKEQLVKELIEYDCKREQK